MKIQQLANVIITENKVKKAKNEIAELGAQYQKHMQQARLAYANNFNVTGSALEKKAEELENRIAELTKKDRATEQLSRKIDRAVAEFGIAQSERGFWLSKQREIFNLLSKACNAMSVGNKEDAKRNTRLLAEMGAGTKEEIAEYVDAILRAAGVPPESELA